MPRGRDYCSPPSQSQLPETPKHPVTDTYQGVTVTDDYRWLGNTKDPAVKKWVDQQNTYSRAQLDKFKDMPALRKRLKELMSAETASYGGLLSQRIAVRASSGNHPPSNHSWSR